MKKTSPLLLWIYLSVAGMFFITLVDRSVAGVSTGLGTVFMNSLLRDLFFLPIVILGFYISKYAAKSVGAPEFFSERKGLTNATILWLVLFFVALILPRLLK